MDKMIYTETTIFISVLENFSRTKELCLKLIVNKTMDFVDIHAKNFENFMVSLI